MSLPRRRGGALVSAGVLIAGGLGIHVLAPDTAATDVAGDLLYALLVYVLLVAAWPRLHPAMTGALALLWCGGVELFQLTGLPVAWAVGVPPLVLVLGTAFDPRDLAVYAVAAVGATFVDLFSRPPMPGTGAFARRSRAGDH